MPRLFLRIAMAHNICVFQYQEYKLKHDIRHKILILIDFIFSNSFYISVIVLRNAVIGGS